MASARRAAMLGLLSLTPILAAGCGGGGGDDETTEAMSSEEIISAATPATVALFGKAGDIPVGGTGFVYDAENGRLITNSHVVEGVNQLQAKVGDTLPTVPARVVGQSVCDDLAVVELVQTPAELQSLAIGDSSTTESGEEVVALGYPSSFQKAKQQSASSTLGTVSNPSLIGNAIGIDLPRYPALIQHTAAINPGNSGGPLINDEGEVIGVNTLTSAPLGNQGQYYAISAEQLNDVLPTLEAGQSPGLIGWSIEPLESMKPAELAADYNEAYGTAPDSALEVATGNIREMRGLYVNAVPENSPAKKAEIYPGDLITAINGTHVSTIPQLCKVLQSQSPGASLEITTVALASGESTEVYGDEFKSTLKLPDEAVVTAPPAEETTSTTSTTTEAAE